MRRPWPATGPRRAGGSPSRRWWVLAGIAFAALIWGWRAGWARGESAALVIALGAGALAWWVDVPAWPGRLRSRAAMPGGLATLGAFAFATVTGGFAVARWLSFNASRDLALMDQLAWNSARGAWLEGTFWTGEPLNYLGGHVSPILAVLGPLYWAAPSPAALLIVQSAAVAVAAVFFFLAARVLTGQPWFALGLTAVILLHPRLHTGLLSDFRQDGFGLMFMAMGLFGLLANRRSWAIAGVGLSLLAKEEIALYWLVFGLVLGAARPGERRRYLGVGLVAGLWLVLAMGVIRPAFAPATADPAWLFARYADFGHDPATILAALVTRPLHTVRILSSPGRILGVLVAVTPFWMVWRDGRWWHLLLLAPLAINLLSVDGIQHRLLGHYFLLPLVGVVLVTLLAAERRAARHDESRWPRLTASLLTVGVVLYLWLSPIGLLIRQTAIRYTVDSHDRQGALLADRIPSDAVVVAQATVATHLAQRSYLTIFPIETGPPPEYYVFDLAESSYPLPQEEVIDRVQVLLDDPDFGVVLYGDGHLVLRRGAVSGANAAARAMAERYRP